MKSTTSGCHGLTPGVQARGTWLGRVLEAYGEHGHMGKMTVLSEGQGVGLGGLRFKRPASWSQDRQVEMGV